MRVGTARRSAPKGQRELFEEFRVRPHGQGDVRLGPEAVVRETRCGAARQTALDLRPGRVDRRIHLGNWCNQSGAGFGERPQASPATGIDAYVWIKPPGESDGSSTAVPNDEGEGFDRMCDPTYTGNARNGNNMSGALPNAPLSGHWFSAQFQQLMQNAYPPLSQRGERPPGPVLPGGAPADRVPHRPGPRPAGALLSRITNLPYRQQNWPARGASAHSGRTWTRG